MMTSLARLLMESEPLLYSCGRACKYITAEEMHLVRAWHTGSTRPVCLWPQWGENYWWWWCWSSAASSRGYFSSPVQASVIACRVDALQVDTGDPGNRPANISPLVWMVLVGPCWPSIILCCQSLQLPNTLVFCLNLVWIPESSCLSTQNKAKNAFFYFPVGNLLQ